jgi:hypothetical protein
MVKKIHLLIKYNILSSDGTDLITPRVFKIHPNTTYVGRDAKAGTGKQYFYVNKSLFCFNKSKKSKFRSMVLVLIVIIVQFIIKMAL